MLRFLSREIILFLKTDKQNVLDKDLISSVGSTPWGKRDLLKYSASLCVFLLFIKQSFSFEMFVHILFFPFLKFQPVEKLNVVQVLIFL